MHNPLIVAKTHHHPKQHTLLISAACGPESGSAWLGARSGSHRVAPGHWLGPRRTSLRGKSLGLPGERSCSQLLEATQASWPWVSPMWPLARKPGENQLTQGRAPVPLKGPSPQVRSRMISLRINSTLRNLSYISENFSFFPAEVTGSGQGFQKRDYTGLTPGGSLRI